MADDQAVGDGEYVVQPGDCLSSIAFEYGMNWRTIWNDPANLDLRQKRKDPMCYCLETASTFAHYEQQEHDRATDAKHKFVKKGVPEKVRLVMLDSESKPRPKLAWRVSVDRAAPISGCTREDGLIEFFIAPNAKSAELTVTEGESEQSFHLDLGRLDPITSVRGVQGRLNDQGYDCGPVDGIIGPRTSAALRAFQEDYYLLPTGELNDDTRDKLKNVHGF